MKKLFTAIAIMATAICFGQTQGNETFPDFYVGTWTNASGTDTISIATDKITWENTIDNQTLISYIDYLIDNTPTVFSFYAYPTVYQLRLQKISRVKIYFHAQTVDGYMRRDDIYFKTGTRANKTE